MFTKIGHACFIYYNSCQYKSLLAFKMFLSKDTLRP